MADGDSSVLQSNFSRRNVHGQVAHALGERIVRGELAPGSLLPPEAELSKHLGVSRTALREAIKLMSAKGLVESRRKAGTRVRPRSAWNLLDPDVLAWQLDSAPGSRFAENLFELRRIVEPEAAALAAERHTEEQAAQLEAAWSALAGAEDEQAWINALRAFYQILLAATQNELIEALGFLPEASFVMALQYEWVSAHRPVTAALRRAAVDAILSRDAAKAREKMSALIDFAGDSMLRKIETTSQEERALADLPFAVR
jgi:DNA-binding FadR family transcriptional regulator